MRLITVALLGALLGCGGGDDTKMVDAPTVPAMIMITGTATKREGTNMSAAVGATIGAYRNGSDATPVVTAMTDATGNYTLMIPTNGMPLDGYLKGTLASFLDTYLYPPKALIADFAGASMNLLNQNTLDLLSGTLCGSAQDPAKGVIAMLVTDGSTAAIAGAMVSSSPAAAKICYNSGGFPNRSATMTDTDGIAYLLNLPAGQVTVSATGSLTFMSHAVNARAGVFTTTLVIP